MTELMCILGGIFTGFFLCYLITKDFYKKPNP